MGEPWCTCTPFLICKSLRPINDSRIGGVILDPDCSVHTDTQAVIKRAQCPACGRAVALRKDGRLYRHGDRLANREHEASRQCAGSGKTPTESGT